MLTQKRNIQMNNFSRLGFIMATLGSSIGLGHIWRFPYMAGENGGGAFVIFYLILALCIGVNETQYPTWPMKLHFHAS